MSLCPIIFKDTENEPNYSKGLSSSGRLSDSAGKVSMDSISRVLTRIFQFLKDKCYAFLKIAQISGENKILLAQKQNLTEEEVTAILNDSNPTIRLELAWNKSISQQTLRRLIRDQDRTVSAVARRRLIKATDEMAIPNI